MDLPTQTHSPPTTTTTTSAHNTISANNTISVNNSGTLYGELRDDNRIRLIFSTSQPINAAWLASRTNAQGMIFRPIQVTLLEETSLKETLLKNTLLKNTTDQTTLPNSLPISSQESASHNSHTYWYEWLSDFIYDDDQRYEFAIQANSTTEIHYAPGKDHTEFYEFSPLATPIWQKAEHQAGGVSLEWTAVPNATHYRIEYGIVDNETPLRVAYSPTHHFFIDNYAVYEFTPRGEQFRVSAINQYGQISDSSAFITASGEYQRPPHQPPKLEVPYFGNGFVTIASNHTHSVSFDGPFRYTGINYYRERGRIRTHYRSDLTASPQDSTEDIIVTLTHNYQPSEYAFTASAPKTVQPQYGHGIFPLPEIELIPRPHSELPHARKFDGAWD